MSAQVQKLFKNGKVITPAALKKLEDILSQDHLTAEIEAEKVLLAIYDASNDPLQLILLKEICKVRGIKLPKPFEPQGVAA